MQTESARARAMSDTRNRILDVALEVLGQNPDAGMSEVASAAGVVRRTVYGHFPARADLVRSLAQRAVDEITVVLADVDAAGAPADVVWVDFIDRLWPVTRRYRVLLALRRGEFGDEIHAILALVDTKLADLVQRGQDAQVFARHLPAGLLSQIALTTVFTIADNALSNRTLDMRAATMTSLLMLGVPTARANDILNDRRDVRAGPPVD
jgi:AcrR family transcriptional regulator